MNPIRKLCEALVYLCLKETRYTVSETFERRECIWLGPNHAIVTVKICGDGWRPDAQTTISGYADEDALITATFDAGEVKGR